MTPEQVREAITDDPAYSPAAKEFCPACGAWTNVNGPNTESHRIGCAIGPWLGGPRPQSGIGSFEWFRREISPLPVEAHSRLQDDPLYQRHTIDITCPAPRHVEDEVLAFERVWWRVKMVVWMLVGLVVVGYVFWRAVK